MWVFSLPGSFHLFNTLILEEEDSEPGITITSEWKLTGRIRSVIATGLHFYSYVLSERPTPGVYYYNDKTNEGRATLEPVTSGSPGLEGKQQNSGFVFYARTPTSKIKTTKLKLVLPPPGSENELCNSDGSSHHV